VGNYFFENIKQEQVEVNTIVSYHFEEERYRRHDPKNMVRELLNKICVPWEYTKGIWEDEEVHKNIQTYDKFIFNRHVQPKGQDCRRRKGKRRSQEEGRERRS
jgi:hypothetical protein